MLLGIGAMLVTIHNELEVAADVSVDGYGNDDDNIVGDWKVLFTILKKFLDSFIVNFDSDRDRNIHHDLEVAADFSIDFYGDDDENIIGDWKVLFTLLKKFLDSFMVNVNSDHDQNMHDDLEGDVDVKANVNGKDDNDINGD